MPWKELLRSCQFQSCPYTKRLRESFSKFCQSSINSLPKGRGKAFRNSAKAPLLVYHAHMLILFMQYLVLLALQGFGRGDNFMCPGFESSSLFLLSFSIQHFVCPHQFPLVYKWEVSNAGLFLNYICSTVVVPIRGLGFL